MFWVMFFEMMFKCRRNYLNASGPNFHGSANRKQRIGGAYGSRKFRANVKHISRGNLAPALARKRRTVIVSAEFGGWQSNKINWVQTFA